MLTFIVFIPALHAGFVVDDFDLLVENPAIVGAHPVLGLARIWASTSQADYFPLTSTSFWLEWRLWKDNPLGYHVTNVLLHIAGVGLLWALLRRLRVPGAWLAAAIFAVHPVSVASVAWISERKNTLSFVFFALTFLAFLQSEERRPLDAKAGRRWYIGALVAFALGLLAKTSGVMLPLVLLGCLWWRQGRLDRTAVMRTVPFFAQSALLGAVTVWFQFHGAMHAQPSGMGVLERVARAAIAVPLYATKLLAPIQLSFVYDPLPRDALLSWLALPVAVLGGLALIVGRLPRARRRAAIFALGAYVVLLLPVVGLVDMALLRYTPIADHWQYLASPALLALVIGGAATWVGRREPQWQRGATILAAALVATLGVSSWRRAAVYTDEETLWRDTIGHAPRSAYAHANLGNELFEHGRRESAKRFFLESLRADPRSPLAPLALYKLALLDLDEGLPDSALERGRAALALDDRYLDARQLVTTLLIHGDRGVEARPHIERLLQSGGRAALVLGRALAREKSDPRAVLAPFLSTSVAAAARTALGTALIDRGDFDGAERELESALHLDPHIAEAYLALGFLADSRGDTARAATLFRKTVELQPDNVEAAQKLQALSRAR